MSNLQWNDSIDNERSIANSQSGKFLKLPNDKDSARIVLLSAPERQEKQGGSTGTFVVFSADVWNCGQGKQQTLDMAATMIDGLIALKREVGQDVLFSSELTVVRCGAAGSKATTYKWSVECPITQATRQAASGQEPASQESVSAPSPRTKEDFLMAEAETVDELRAIYQKLQDEASDDGENMDRNFRFFTAFRKYLRAQ